MTEQPMETVAVPVADVQTAVLETYATHPDSAWRRNMTQALAPPLPEVPASGVALNSLGQRFVRVASHRGGGIWRHLSDNGKLGATYLSWEDLVVKEPSVTPLVRA